MPFFAKKIIVDGAIKPAAESGLGAAATSLIVPGSLGSEGDSAGASEAVAEASFYLAQAIRQAEAGVHIREIKFDKYLEKLQEIPAHRLQGVRHPYHFTKEGARLIRCASEASRDVYKDKVVLPNTDKLLTPQDTGCKAVLLRRLETSNSLTSTVSSTLVVSIRGTVSTLPDWMLNFNNAPKEDNSILWRGREWHRGFLKAGQKMQEELTRALNEVLKISGPFDSLLLTGHSAGGALAQLFYAMSMTQSNPMAHVAQQFADVHCITFGTPPIANSAISPGSTGLFLSIVNDGDLVALAQTDYIKVLIDIIVLRIEDIRAKWGQSGSDQILLGDPFYQFSGSCIILRDVDPNGDTEKEAYEACAVTNADLAQLLYGDIGAHLMKEYITRLNYVLDLQVAKV